MEFTNVAIPVGSGGLNLRDMPEFLADGESTVLKNFITLGDGRIGPRKAFKVHPNEIITGDIIAVIPFAVGLYDTDKRRGGVVLAWDADDDEVKLYDVDTNGLNPVEYETLWEDAETRPRIAWGRLFRRLFICDTGRVHGMSIYDPSLDMGGGEAIFQPTFEFAGGSASAIISRWIAQHQNMLFVGGYGTEDDQDRSENVRFSYLGLTDDGEGAGDAGADAASENLFDIDDYFSFTEAGIPVVGAAGAMGRLVMCTPYQIHALFGSDRDTFQATLLDNERGLIATRAIGEAAGKVWGWDGTHGPWVYDGQIRDLSEKILPRLSEVGRNSIFFDHAPDAREVRWFYALNNSGDPDRCFAYNYEKGTFREHELPFAVICGGRISPFWSATTGESGEEDDETPPAAAPSDLDHELVTRSSGISTWVNGDTAPNVTTEVEREVDGEGFEVVATLGPEVSSFAHTGLDADTLYNVKVRHKKNGEYSSYDTDSFTTLEASEISAPFGVSAIDFPVGEVSGVSLTWSLADAGVFTEVWRNIGSGWVAYATTAVDATAYLDQAVISGIEHFYKLRASDGVDSSDFSDIVSVPPT